MTTPLLAQLLQNPRFQAALENPDYFQVPNEGPGPALDDPNNVTGQSAATLLQPSRKPSFAERLKAALPQMVSGAIDAVATPNIAGGGPVDIARALQSARDRQIERDVLAHNMARQQAMDERLRAQAERDLAYADWLERRETEKQPGAQAVGSFGWYDREGKWHDAPQKPVERRLVQVTPEVGKALGIVPDAEGKYMAPESAISANIRATAPKPLTGERAKVDLLKRGYMAQGLTEEAAEEKALEDYRRGYIQNIDTSQAREIQAKASAGRAVAGTERTRQLTEQGEHKTSAQKLADQALSESEAGLRASGIENPTPEQIAENAIKNLNPEMAQYYVGIDPQTRVSAMAEIRRRADARKKGGAEKIGKTLLQAAVEALGGATPAPTQASAQPKTPAPAPATHPAKRTSAKPQKIFPRSRLAEYARVNDITEQVAEEYLKKQGWTVQ